jgi:hypothetical protein
MANLGFHIAMRQAGIRVVQTDVGDRYVLEALLAGGYSLGGEQSGHVIFPDHATTAWDDDPRSPCSTWCSVRASSCRNWRRRR